MRNTLKSRINLAASVGLLLLSAVFGIAYYEQYFQRRDCFNELGRCLDPVTGVVYTDQSGPVWLALAAITLAASVWQFLAFRRRRRSAGLSDAGKRPD